MKYVNPRKDMTATNKNNLGSLVVPKSQLTIPEPENLDDAIAFLGGPDKTFLFLKTAFATAAQNDGRVVLRNRKVEEGETKEQAIAAAITEAIEASRTWTYGGVRRGGVTQKQAKNAVTTLLADTTKTSFTREELEALLAAAK